MRKVFGRVAISVRSFARGLSGLQGAAGVGAVGAGTWIEFGPGFGLISVGVFLLLGAWASR